jgi:hypothetical protein
MRCERLAPRCPRPSRRSRSAPIRSRPPNAAIARITYHMIRLPRSTESLPSTQTPFTNRHRNLFPARMTKNIAFVTQRSTHGTGDHLYSSDSCRQPRVHWFHSRHSTRISLPTFAIPNRSQYIDPLPEHRCGSCSSMERMYLPILAIGVSRPSTTMHKPDHPRLHQLLDSARQPICSPMESTNSLGPWRALVDLPAL